MLNTEFRVIENIVQSDSQGKIAFETGITSKIYRVLINDLGHILLEPIVDIPGRERWLFENPEALEAVKQGLKDSAQGRGEYIGSFAQYADLEIDNCDELSF
ncbi:MAG: hypothetical protein VKJ02_06350 [Snowella sp.]|nr:hypothetical protein [Snowella sp.]